MMQLKLRAKELACATGVRPVQSRLLPRYVYNFTPAQLCFLCKCIERTRHVPGVVVEIGCAAGHSTIFLNRFMDAVGIEKSYVCIDTFAGFTKRDVEYESTVRGKSKSAYGSAWKDWSDDLFRSTMSFNLIRRVTAIRADVNDYDFRSAGPISFCLLDVDLYQPVKAALRGVFEQLSPGGIIVVDDCAPDQKYDGARQAYAEFISGLGWNSDFRFDKLGVVDTGGRK